MPRQLDTLRDYYEKLLIWEKVAPCELIAPWPLSVAQSVESAIGSAFVQSGMKDSKLRLSEGSENQSVGNQMAEYFFSKLAPMLSVWTLSRCSGQGYPDQILENQAAVIALEVKATSEWRIKDSNRIVLTSSSRKLRARFRAPIYHLLATVQYAVVGVDEALVHALRLDFLMPDSLVNIRFEGSVSQKLLSDAAHRTALF